MSVSWKHLTPSNLENKILAFHCECLLESSLKLTEVGTLLMVLQTHSVTGELVKNKCHLLPLSAGNI